MHKAGLLILLTWSSEFCPPTEKNTLFVECTGNQLGSHIPWWLWEAPLMALASDMWTFDNRSVDNADMRDWISLLTGQVCGLRVLPHFVVSRHISWGCCPVMGVQPRCWESTLHGLSADYLIRLGWWIQPYQLPNIAVEKRFQWCILPCLDSLNSKILKWQMISGVSSNYLTLGLLFPTSSKIQMWLYETMSGWGPTVVW